MRVDRARASLTSSPLPLPTQGKVDQSYEQKLFDLRPQHQKDKAPILPIQPHTSKKANSMVNVDTIATHLSIWPNLRQSNPSSLNLFHPP